MGDPWHRSLDAEDALTEIGVLKHLSVQPDLPVYLLKMLGVYSEPENRFTWLVTEFADGGELFDVASAGRVGEARAREYTWQLLQAVKYLHRHHIGHRDISLENVLLKDGVVRLMDFGMAVRSHTSSGEPLRYFRAVGKDFYRAPECYVPSREEVTVLAPPSSNPGDIVMARAAVANDIFLCEVCLPKGASPGATCHADVWGYAAVPADVFAVGVCLFILAFQCPPWERAKLTNRLFAHFHKDEEGSLESSLKMWRRDDWLSPQGKQAISSMLRANPVKRPCAESALNHSWFA